MIYFLGCISDFRFIRYGSFNVSGQLNSSTSYKVKDICECASKSRDEFPMTVAYDFNNETTECVLYTKLGNITHHDNRRAYIKDNDNITCDEDVLCMS